MHFLIDEMDTDIYSRIPELPEKESESDSSDSSWWPYVFRESSFE